MLRLFVGIALPPEQRLALSTICLGLPGMRWVDPGNFHVTLRFIGEIDEGLAADIDAALLRVRQARFSLAIAGTGVFGPAGKPRVLYAGLDRSAPLVQLRERIDHALMRTGLPPDPQRFIPHITLGKVQGAAPDALRRFAGHHNLLRLPAFPVEQFNLIRSYLTRSGSLYEDIADYPLG